MHDGAVDAGSVEVVEEGHVGVEVAKFLDAPVESVEKILDGRDLRRCVRESPEEEQTFVEANELVRVSELKFGELGEKFGDDVGMAWVEAALSGFELGEELVGIVGGAWHGRRDSVTQKAKIKIPTPSTSLRAGSLAKNARRLGPREKWGTRSCRGARAHIYSG
ncbi:MAG: hypothetical protein WB660_10825 [Candidatus Sulfotelmatobacter sp.]